MIKQQQSGCWRFRSCRSGCCSCCSCCSLPGAEATWWLSNKFCFHRYSCCRCCCCRCCCCRCSFCGFSCCQCVCCSLVEAAWWSSDMCWRSSCPAWFTCCGCWRSVVSVTLKQHCSNSLDYVNAAGEAAMDDEVSQGKATLRWMKMNALVVVDC